MKTAAFVSLLFLLGLSAQVATLAQAPTSNQAQACTGLCLQQVACPQGGTTSVTGKVFAPNGVDPLPDVEVYVPNAPVDAFTPGVSCAVAGTPPSGSPLVGAVSAVDGTFTITNVPVGNDIPLVAVTGRWRRQIAIPTVTACTGTAQDVRLPKNQSEGDIPKFAIATGAVDSVECVLRKVGLDDAEFTDPSGTGRVNLYSGSFGPGAVASNSTPSEGALMGNSTTLNGYDVLMLPCEGEQFPRSSSELSNLVNFADSGGRVYSSHYSFFWLYQNPPFDQTAHWNINQTRPNDGIATVDTSFPKGETLAEWLQLVGASTTQGQINVVQTRHDLNGVIAPTQSWLTLNDTAHGNPVMQFVFDTPIAKKNQCGRVLFNEYHVENASGSSKTFPAECDSAPMSPQEKLLEFSLFDLTSDGGQSSLAPTGQDFGTQPVGFDSAPQSFTWTNNSSFSSGLTGITTSGDFRVTASNCATVAAGDSCHIAVVFNPTAIGARSGTLKVASPGSNATASLTGTGIPALVYSLNALDFGSLDVGASRTLQFSVSNTASGPLLLPAFAVSGDYALSDSCGGTLAAGASCTINVTFTPTTTGARTGTLAVNSTSAAYPGTPAMLTGNGIDFTVVGSASSGQVIAGYGTSTKLTITPIAGFAAPVALTCSTTMPGSTCVFSPNAFTPASATTANVTITTTSKYTVIGYGGTGANFWLALLGLGSGGLLWTMRRRAGSIARGLAVVLALALAAGATTGCSGKLPAQNAIYTAPGTYNLIMTATDGFLSRSATYSLKVTAK